MAIFTPELLEKLKLGYYFWPIFLVCVIVYLILHYFVTLWHITTTLRWVAKPPSVPILGNAFQFFGKSVSDHWKMSTEWLDKYGDMVQVWIFHRPTIVVSRKEVAERLLKGTGDTLTKKSEQYSYLSDVFGGSLLTFSAVDWMTRRKLLDPFFHDGSLHGSIPTVCHHARALVSHLSDKAKKSDIIDIQQYSKLTTLDVTADTLMKASPNFLEQSNNSYLDAIKTTTEILTKRSYTPMYNWNIIYLFTLTRILQSKAAKIINDFANKVIQKRKKSRMSEKKSDQEDNKQSNFLDFLLDKEENNILKEKEVRNEVNTFLFAAHDTVATGIAFTLYLIGRNPEIQERLYKEIKSELPELSGEKDPSMDRLNKLDLLGRCIKEGLRLYPPVPWIGRVLKNYIKIDGENKFPEGANVAINVYKLHRNEKYYTNPNEFDPDRFLNDNIKETDNYSYIPFGAGWRNCIGQKFALLEMKIILAHIINQYSVMSIDKPEDLELSGNVILRSIKGLNVRLHQRN